LCFEAENDHVGNCAPTVAKTCRSEQGELFFYLLFNLFLILIFFQFIMLKKQEIHRSLVSTLDDTEAIETKQQESEIIPTKMEDIR
jgi:hypothetical protein